MHYYINLMRSSNACCQCKNKALNTMYTQQSSINPLLRHSVRCSRNLHVNLVIHILLEIFFLRFRFQNSFEAGKLLTKMSMLMKVILMNISIPLSLDQLEKVYDDINYVSQKRGTMSH